MSAENPERAAQSGRRPAFGYDVFLSHNRADKDWVRELAALLAEHRYNGRPLRPWLDEQVLDPGTPRRGEELGTALERSRLLVIVLSPEALASPWVQYELRQFLASRSRDEIVALRRRSCELPEALASLDILDWPGEAASEPNFRQLTARLCPGAGVDFAPIEQAVKDAWYESLCSGTPAFDPTPTAENGALAATLLKFDIADAAEEGLSLHAFDQVGDCMLRLNPSDSNRMKMILGEILALAVLKNERYRQIAPRFLAREPADEVLPDLSYAVLRAASKLAEIDLALVDPSSVWAALAKLDRAGRFSVERRVVAMIAGRVVAKLRGSALGELLIRALCVGGEASQLAAIAGITTAEEHSEPVFHLAELARIAGRVGTPPAPSVAPSRRLYDLLQQIDAGRSEFLARALKNGLADLARAFGERRSEGADDWPQLRDESPPPLIRNGPIIGVVRRISAANMEKIAPGLRVVDVACLTEPRIVDALLDQCGGFIIEQQAADSPLCLRLAGRDRRFAMLERSRLESLAEGDNVALDRCRMTVLPGPLVPREAERSG